jgi:hypothetical protein
VFIRDFVKQDDGTWMVYHYSEKETVQTREDEIYDQLTSHGRTDATYNLDNVGFGHAFKLLDKARHNSTIPPILETAHLPDPDEYYGMAEFTNQSLLDMINRVASLRTRIIRENAEPVDVLTGADLDDVEDNDGILTIPSPNAKVTRLSLSSDLNAVTSTLEHLIEIFLGEMRVVILKGEAKDLQRVTNAAVRTLFLDALAKNSVLWAAYSTTLGALFRLALLMGYGNGDIEENPLDKSITITMPTPLPVDYSEIANINALAINNGYRSKHSASVAIGDDPKFEEAMIELEHAKSMERQQEQMEMMHEVSVATGGGEEDSDSAPPETSEKESSDE